MENKASRIKLVLLAAATAGTMAAGFEGLRQTAYLDPRPGDPILTVCYGSTTDVEKNKRYTIEECKQRLDDDMLNAVLIVERCHPDIPLNVLVAFADATYNIGPKVACNSTASRYLTAKNYRAACLELLKWDKANGTRLPGLTRRRKAEVEVCLGGST